MTAYLDLGRLRQDLDQLLRACLCTGAAADAVVASDDRYAVDDPDRVELACFDAVAQSDTAVRALFASAEQLLGSLAGSHILIIIKLRGIVRGAVAHNESDLFLQISRVLSHQGSKLFGDGRAADRTLRAGCLGAVYERMRVVVTAGETAAAAVRAGKFSAQFNKERVFLHCKNFGSEAEHTGS